MPFYEWNPQKLALNIPAMDQEHMRIIDIMNKLFDANEANATHASLMRLMDDLVRVTQGHFRHEEQFMESISYPSLSTHRMIHESLIGELTNHVSQFRSSSGRVPEGFFRFLRVWLNAHIMGIDTKYAQTVQPK